MVDPADITPTLPQVARHIHTRTRESYDGFGGPGTKEAGTFNDNTVPTGEQAQPFAEYAARTVVRELGTSKVEWTPGLIADAIDVASLQAALSIEQSFYGDGTSSSDSTDQLGRMYREQLASLVATASGNQTGGWRFSSIRMVTSQAVLDEEAAAAE